MFKLDSTLKVCIHFNLITETQAGAIEVLRDALLLEACLGALDKKVIGQDTLDKILFTDFLLERGSVFFDSNNKEYQDWGWLTSLVACRKSSEGEWFSIQKVDEEFKLVQHYVVDEDLAYCKGNSEIKRGTLISMVEILQLRTGCLC